MSNMCKGGTMIYPMRWFIHEVVKLFNKAIGYKIWDRNDIPKLVK